MSIADPDASGVFAITLLHAFVAASLEIAGVGKVDGVRHLSGN